MSKLVKYASIFFSLFLSGTFIFSQDFQVNTLASQIPSPWGAQFLPDGSLLGTSRTQGLWHYSQGKITMLPLSLEVSTDGQGGYLGLALSPGFASNSLVYLSFSRRASGLSKAALARGRWTGTGLEALKVLWSDQPPTGTTVHYGSRLVFGKDGLLYMTLGERGAQNRAQDLKDPAGKVLRFTPEGTPAPGNPFQENPYIYTFGHRNPQGLALHPETGELWLTEHGPKGGDEVNVLKPGANYGWPLSTFGVNYNGSPVSSHQNLPGIEPPRIYWTPSIAPSGLTFYHGAAFPQWNGNLFSGNLAGQELRRLEVNAQGEITHQETLLKNQVGRIRDVLLGPEGFIYLLTDGIQGKLLRLEPVGH